MTTWQLVLASYTPEKRSWDHTYPWIYYGARPLSFPLTWLAFALRLTPNQVTFLSLVAGVGAFVLIAMGESGFLAGSCLFALLNILDCVDGNLARMSRSSSPSGKFYDSAVGLVFYLIYFVLGIGLYQTPDSSLSQVLSPFGVGTVPPVVYVLLGAIATLCRFLGLHVQSIFTSALGPTWETKKAAEGEDVPLHKRSYYRIYHNLTDIQGQDPILIGAAATGRVGLYLALSAVIQILNLAGLVGLFVRRARHLSRPPA